MAYERAAASQVLAEGLDGFVQSKLDALKTQMTLRNSADEERFNRAVLEQGISLDDQLAFRKDQLKDIQDDPAEAKRIRGEISTLTQRVAAKKFDDAYTNQLIANESGAESIDSVVSFLKDQKDKTTDPTMRAKIDQALVQQTANRFDITQRAMTDQTNYALNDKTPTIIDAQIAKVQSAKNSAILSGNSDLLTNYDLQLQSLSKAKNEGEIERSTKDMAVATLAGNSSATALLDSYNGKLASAASTGPVTIGGVTYNSPKEFWQFKRDSYISDNSGNGFFDRFNQEQKDRLQTKNSSNTLTNNDLTQTTAGYDALTNRPELASYVTNINNGKQGVLQGGADLRAQSVVNNYLVDYDVNKAFSDLTALKALGVNVEDAQTKILLHAADVKESQVGKIFSTAQSLLQANPGMTPQEAIDQAVKTGAGIALSPTQLVTKNEQQIANESATAAAKGSVLPEPRTTATVDAAKLTPTPPPVAPTTNDVSQKYGIVGKAVYDKATGQAFTNEQDFFKASGLTSFQNVKFDTNYAPPVPGASPTLQNTPSAPAAPAATTPQATTQTYKVAAGDTLAAIAQKFLGDSKRYTDIAKSNNIANPNLIKPGQELVIPIK